MKMEMEELERMIDDRSKAQAEQVTKDLQKNLGATVSQAQIDEAVKTALAEINAKAEKIAVSVIFFKLSHFAYAESPILITLLGIIIFSKLVHP